MKTRASNNTNRNNNGNGNYNGNRNGDQNGNHNYKRNRNCNRNSSYNVNINSSDNVTCDSCGLTRQLCDPPNHNGTAYCWTHVKTINDLHSSVVCRYPAIGHKGNATFENTQYYSTLLMSLQGEADMFFKIQLKIKIKLILQHPIRSPHICTMHI